MVRGTNETGLDPLLPTMPRGVEAVSVGAARATNGRVVAGRYSLVRWLGAGSHAEVWEATDALTGDTVAVKLLGPATATRQARVRREVAVLRRLRLPGVVRLLDEGTDSSGEFLVMERVLGTPFPGALGRAWPTLVTVTTALLETLARVHAAGVIHRDLKPANVLVDASGRPTVLDFGVSWASLGTDLTGAGQMLGTPAYLAPEQIVGEAVSPRTDLYSLGVMLFEALTGRLPHEGNSVPSILYARMTRRAFGLRDLAPEVPSAVADVVDLLLAQSATERPRSAVEVLGMLRGEALGVSGAPRLPRLGGDAPVRAVVEAVLAGRPIDVVGDTGTGRSRCLRDAADTLSREGRRLVWALPARAPFASLEPLVGTLDEHASRGLDEVVLAVEAAVRGAITGGLVLFADDADRLDPWSRSAVARCREAGAVVRALPRAGGVEGAVALEPLEESALRALFAGPERLFHLPADGARLLWARTGGVAARVEEEVSAWVRAGIARWDERLLIVERDALDQFDASLRVAPPVDRAFAATRPTLAPHLDDLLSWLALAWPHTRGDVIAAAMAQPAWRIEAEAEELVACGAARRLPDGRLEPCTISLAEPAWPWERRQRAHRAIARALPRGAEGRLLHILAGADAAEESAMVIADEAATLARTRAEAGHLGHAVAALADALLAVRQWCSDAGRHDPASGLHIQGAWVEIALFDGTPRALDRVLYELCRVSSGTEATEHLADLVRAALARSAGGERALEVAEAIAPFAELPLERRRHGVRVAAARRCSREREETVLANVARWAEECGDSQARAALAGWMGRLRYRQGRFDDAAALHVEAARQEAWVTTRIEATIAAASAWMEGFRHGEAEVWARSGLALAEGCRHPYHAARAEWILRSMAYRTGAASAPDHELVDAVAALGVLDAEALVCLTEAAVAWRVGRWSEGRALAMRVHRIWTPTAWTWGAMLARCLALACGDEAAKDEVKALAASAGACHLPRIGLQALGLLGELFPEARDEWRVAAEALAATVPREFWPLRMEVISVAEALAGVGCEVEFSRAEMSD